MTGADEAANDVGNPAVAAALGELIEAHHLIVLGGHRTEFQACEVGVSHCGRVIYDRERLVEHFVEVQGMAEEDAEEWVGFNVEPLGVVLVV
jgi:hypothetical protein